MNHPLSLVPTPLLFAVSLMALSILGPFTTGAHAQSPDLARLGTAQEALKHVTQEQRERIEKLVPGASDAQIEQLKTALEAHEKTATWTNVLSSVNTKALAGVFGFAGWFAGGGIASVVSSGFVAAIPVVAGAIVAGAVVGAGASLAINHYVIHPRNVDALNQAIEGLGTGQSLAGSQQAKVDPASTGDGTGMTLLETTASSVASR